MAGYKRYAVLVAFVSHAMCNQFMFMDFATIPDITTNVLATDEAGVNFLYTASLISAIPSILFTLALIDQYNWVVSFCGVASTVAAAWIRYAAVKQASYNLAIISSIFLGLGIGIIFVGFVQVPRDWFPAKGANTLAMAVAVQMTFFGWGMGGLIIPLLVTSASTITHFSFCQAMAASLCFFVFLVCHRAPQTRVDETQLGAVAQEEQEPVHPDLSLQAAIRLLLRNGHYLLQSVACGLFQGVGFAIPAVLTEVFEEQGYGSYECAWLSFAFIMAGVVLGLLLAYILPQSSSLKVRKRIVLVLFWSGVVAVVALQALGSFAHAVGHSIHSVAVVACVIISGSCSLGFVNVTLPLVCEYAWPVSESRSGGFTELLGFAMGAAFSQVSTGNGFWPCCFGSLTAALLMSASFCRSHQNEALIDARTSVNMRRASRTSNS